MAVLMHVGDVRDHRRRRCGTASSPLRRLAGTSWPQPRWRSGGGRPSPRPPRGRSGGRTRSDCCSGATPPSACCPAPMPR
eukprot:6136558-Pyramimonas_sp.AAC.2